MFLKKILFPLVIALMAAGCGKDVLKISRDSKNNMPGSKHDEDNKDNKDNNKDSDKTPTLTDTMVVELTFAEAMAKGGKAPIFATTSDSSDFSEPQFNPNPDCNTLKYDKTKPNWAQAIAYVAATGRCDKVEITYCVSSSDVHQILGKAKINGFPCPNFGQVKVEADAAASENEADLRLTYPADIVAMIVSNDEKECTQANNWQNIAASIKRWPLAAADKKIVYGKFKDNLERSSLCFAFELDANKLALPLKAPAEGKFSLASYYKCLLEATGEVKCWADESNSKAIHILNDAVDISSNMDKSCAVVNDGTVKCWTLLESDNENNATFSLPKTIPGIAQTKNVIVSDYQNCAIHRNGQMTCWGWGGAGDAEQQARLIPELNNVTDVSIYYRTICALTAGSARCWNGNDQASDKLTMKSYFLTATSLVSQGANLCAVMANGEVQCLDMSNLNSTPANVPVIKTAKTLTAGYSHICATMQDNSVACWGEGRSGQLATSEKWRTHNPTVITGVRASQIVASGNRTCTWNAQRESWCWGHTSTFYNSEPTRVGNIIGASEVQAGVDLSCVVSPVPNSQEKSFSCWGGYVIDNYNDHTEKLWNVSPIPNLPSASAISPGYQTCALLNDSSLACWRRMVGIEKFQDLPELIKDQNGTVIKNIVQVSGGYNQRCILLNDKSVRCWGDSRVGPFDTENVVTPEIVSGLTDIKSIAVGFDNGCALHENGKVSCWGQGIFNNEEELRTRAPILILTEEGTPLDNVEAIVSGRSFACGLLSDKKVACWGKNLDLSPKATVVPDLSSVLSLAAGNAHACAVLANHTLSCWGFGYYGQTGREYSFDTDPAVVLGLTDVSAVTAGWDHTCVLLGNGSVQCFGSGEYGQLGIAPTMQPWGLQKFIVP